MLSLILRNIFFTILQPGVVAGLIPYLIVKRKPDVLFPHHWLLQHYIGVITFVIGLMVMFHCILTFAIKGRGTLSPADPTRKLVIKGLYKFSRNPMYVGVLLILIGEAAFLQSADLWWYVLIVFIAFNLFIRYYEEPRLLKDFREEYTAYTQRVRKWI